jgi:hypothetical protein
MRKGVPFPFSQKGVFPNHLETLPCRDAPDLPDANFFLQQLFQRGFKKMGASHFLI